jgi:hypothetical protein
MYALARLLHEMGAVAADYDRRVTNNPTCPTCNCPTHRADQADLHLPDLPDLPDMPDLPDLHLPDLHRSDLHMHRHDQSGPAQHILRPQANFLTNIILIHKKLYSNNGNSGRHERTQSVWISDLVSNFIKQIYLFIYIKLLEYLF